MGNEGLHYQLHWPNGLCPFFFFIVFIIVFIVTITSAAFPPSPHFLLVTSRACSSNTCFGLLGSPLLVLSLLFSAPSAGPPPWPATLFAAAPACASDWCAGSGDWRPGFGADISFFVPLGSGWRRGGGLACGVLYCRCWASRVSVFFTWARAFLVSRTVVGVAERKEVLGIVDVL